jgi:putative transposase
MKFEAPGPFYHIIFRKMIPTSPSQMEEDFQKLTSTLETVSLRHGARVHCFCLMPNHYHLLLEAPQFNLHTVLTHLNLYETGSWSGKKASRLSRGRYRVIPTTRRIERIELSRSIHLNPVRASLVNDPSQYPWSSYFAYLESEMRWDWLQTGFILSQFARDEEEAQQRYRNYVWGAVRKILQTSPAPAGLPSWAHARETVHPGP